MIEKYNLNDSEIYKKLFYVTSFFAPGFLAIMYYKYELFVQLEWLKLLSFSALFTVCFSSPPILVNLFLDRIQSRSKKGLKKRHRDGRLHTSFSISGILPRHISVVLSLFGIVATSVFFDYFFSNINIDFKDLVLCLFYIYFLWQPLNLVGLFFIHNARIISNRKWVGVFIEIFGYVVLAASNVLLLEGLNQVELTK